MPFISVQNRQILFIHIPKTGGTSVCEWLSTIAPLHLQSTSRTQGLAVFPQHFRHVDIKALFAPNFFAYRFAIVRDPYARIVSEYRYRAAMQRERGLNVPEFSLWLDNHLTQAAQKPQHLDNHLRPQVDFIGSGVHIFRLEDGLAGIIAKVAEANELPLPAEIPRARPGDNAFGPESWDLQDRLMVNRHYAEDFAHFGYPLLTD